MNLLKNNGWKCLWRGHPAQPTDQLKPPVIPPPGGERPLGPKSIEIIKRQRRQRKILQADLHCDTVLQFCGALPSPLPGGEPSRHFGGDYRGRGGKVGFVTHPSPLSQPPELWVTERSAMEMPAASKPTGAPQVDVHSGCRPEFMANRRQPSKGMWQQGVRTVHMWNGVWFDHLLPTGTAEQCCMCILGRACVERVLTCVHPPRPLQGKGSEWRSASRRRQQQTRSSHHGVMPKPPPPNNNNNDSGSRAL